MGNREYLGRDLLPAQSAQLGAAGTIITVSNLACDTLGGFKAIFKLDAEVTTYQTLWVQFNGLETNTIRQFWSRAIDGTNASPAWVWGPYSKFGDSNYTAGATGRTAEITIECTRPESTALVREFKVDGWFRFNGGGTEDYWFGGRLLWSGTGELTSIGVRSSVTGALAATSSVALWR